MIADADRDWILGPWRAGVLYENGDIEWLFTGPVIEAGPREWMPRTTAAEKANEMLSERMNAYRMGRPVREGRRDPPPRRPLAAVVSGPSNPVELADVDRPDLSAGRKFWWAVLKPSSDGLSILSMHELRAEAEALAAQNGYVLGIAFTSESAAYTVDRLTTEPVTSAGGGLGQ